MKMTNQEFVDQIMKIANLRHGPADVDARKAFTTTSTAAYGELSMAAIEFEGSPPVFQVLWIGGKSPGYCYVDGHLVKKPAVVQKIKQLILDFLRFIGDDIHMFDRQFIRGSRLESTDYAESGGVCAANIARKAQLSVWTKEHQITADLTPKEVIGLATFFNGFIGMTLHGTPPPRAYLCEREKRPVADPW